MIAISAVLLTATSAAATPAAAADCKLANSQVRLKSKEARVLVRREQEDGFTGTRYYACLKRSAPREIAFAGDQTAVELDDVDPIRLAGRYLAFGSSATGLDSTISGRVTVIDLRRFRRVLDVEAGRAGQDAQRTAGVSALKLLRDGTVAWIAGVADPAATFQVHIARDRRRQLLAAGPNVSPTKLALSARDVRWEDNAQPVVAPLVQALRGPPA